ncbi:MAG: hypothetical protein QM820_34770 [Minicystis sp.]
MHERRRQRSEVPGEAARLYLQSVADRHGLSALALANEDGLLMAGASRAEQPLDLDWIAAVGCVCALPGRRGQSLGSVVERVTGGRTLASAEIVLRGEKLYVTSVGGPLPPMKELAAGVERILARSLPAAA